MNIARALHRGWQIAVCFVLVLAWLSVFKWDAAGFDEYVPPEDEVASCVLFTADGYTYSYTDGNENKSLTRSEYFSKYMKLSDVDVVENIARVGMQTQKDYVRVSTGWDYDEHLPEGMDDNWTSVVIYRLLNGREVYRIIRVPYDINAEWMNEVLSSSEYKTAFFDVDRLQKLLPKKMSQGGKLGIEYETIFDNVSEDVELDDVLSVLSAYKEDISLYDFSYIGSHDCLGTFAISFTDSGDGYQLYPYYPVYEGFDRTIEALQKMGVFISVRPRRSEVAVAGVGKDLYDEEGNFLSFEERAYFEKDKAQTLSEAVDANYYGDWSVAKYGEGSYSVVLITKDEMERASEPLEEGSLFDKNIGRTYTLYKKDAPAFVVEDFGDE